MKVRLDYVTNSSSSSFIIDKSVEEVKNLIKDTCEYMVNIYSELKSIGLNDIETEYTSNCSVIQDIVDRIYDKYNFKYFLNTDCKIKHYVYYFHNNIEHIKDDICTDLNYSDTDIENYKKLYKMISASNVEEYIQIFNTNNLDTHDKESAIEEIYCWYEEYINNLKKLLENKTVVYQEDTCIFPDFLCKVLTIHSVLSCNHMG